jgi:hypothetical protein
MSDAASISTKASPSADEALHDLNALVVSCPELRELEKLLGNFNLFRVLRFEHGEIRHSNVLSWLFDPDESHGLRDLFVRRWLMRVFHDATEDEQSYLDPVEIDACTIRAVTVYREWNHLDLLLRIETFEHGEWIVAIENKVGAKQYLGQLLNYRKSVELAFRGARHRLYIFLTRSGEEAEDKVWTTTTYGELHKVLNDCVEEQRDVIGTEPRVLLNHYLGILEEHFMENTRIAELSRKIYKAHSRALDIIFEHRPDALMRLTEAVKTRMESDASKLNIVPMITTKGYVRFLPSAWNTKANRQGHMWHEKDSAFVLCEIDLLRKQPTFVMIECGSPAKWRNALWEMSKQQPFKTLRRTNKQPSMWMRVYSVRGPMYLQDVEVGTEEDLAEEIWDWCKKQLSEETFKKSQTAVEDHLTKLKTLL